MIKKMKMFKLLFIVVLHFCFIQSKKERQSCSEYVNKLTKNFNNIADHGELKETLLYSGKGLNELGYYEACKKLDSHNYFFLSIQVSKIAGGPGIGLCLPNVCSARDLNISLAPKFNSIK